VGPGPAGVLAGGGLFPTALCRGGRGTGRRSAAPLDGGRLLGADPASGARGRPGWSGGGDQVLPRDLAPGRLAPATLAGGGDHRRARVGRGVRTAWAPRCLLLLQLRPASVVSRELCRLRDRLGPHALPAGAGR